LSYFRKEAISAKIFAQWIWPDSHGARI